MACGSAITVLYDDGENASCTDCGEIVPCLINHPASTDTHRIEQVTCVCCNSEIITFHSGNAPSKQPAALGSDLRSTSAGTESLQGSERIN